MHRFTLSLLAMLTAASIAHAADADELLNRPASAASTSITAMPAEPFYVYA
jgi:hypothetical protein